MSMMNIGADMHSTEYERTFWDALRRKNVETQCLRTGRNSLTGAFELPYADRPQCEDAITAESAFRKVATVIKADRESQIRTYDFENVASWVPEGGAIPTEDMENDFNKLPMLSHKLVVLTKVDNDFVYDAGFDFKSLFLSKLSRSFATAEDEAFVNGTGASMPTGILSDDAGAEVGITTAELTYDDVIKLYFSLDKKYRDHGVWMMNDETALLLRTMKDNAGNYIWNQTNDTILGKQVVLCKAMPSVTSGAKPIVFGDFSYYWIVIRRAMAIRTLPEKFILNDQTGYLAHEFMDAKLVHRDAIKAIQIGH